MRNHGASKYANEGCRCDICRNGNRLRAITARARRKAGIKGDVRSLDAPQHHGVAAYSNWGCRCDICYQAKSEANASYHRQWRAKA